MDPDVAELLGSTRPPPPNRRGEIAEFYEPGMSERDMVLRQRRRHLALEPPSPAVVLRTVLGIVDDPEWGWDPLPGCGCFLCRRGGGEPLPPKFSASSV